MGCKEYRISDYFRLTPTTESQETHTGFSIGTNKNSPRGFKPVVSVSISNYRYYSPELGRWLSRDWIGEKGGVNLYNMLGNNLLSWWDNLGMSGVTIKFVGKAFYPFAFKSPLSKAQWKPSKWEREAHYDAKSDMTCCWYKKQPEYDVIFPMLDLKTERDEKDRLQHVDKYTVGYRDNGDPVYATKDIIDKMRDHEAGHERDFNKLFNETIQKSLDIASKNVGKKKPYKIKGNRPNRCKNELYKLAKLKEEVQNFFDKYGKVNKARDAKQRMSMGEADMFGEYWLKESPHIKGGYDDDYNY